MNIEVRLLWGATVGLWILAGVAYECDSKFGAVVGLLAAIFVAVIAGTMTVVDKISELQVHWGPLVKKLREVDSHER